MAVGVPEAVSTIVCNPVPIKVPLPEKVTPLAVIEMLYVPAVVTLAVMVWVTPETATPVLKVPADAVLQSVQVTTAVPLVEGCIPFQAFQFGVPEVPVLVSIEFNVVL